MTETKKAVYPWSENAKEKVPVVPAAPGTVLSGDEGKTVLFSPLKLRDVTLKNRIGVSPMCMYSSVDGGWTDWHLRHLGSFAVGGAGLIFTEATGVLPNGRITPNCTGLWKDEQIEPLKRIVDFVHEHKAAIGIQLAHAGRKASTWAPWAARPGAGDVATAEYGGWPDNVWGPSTLKFSDSYPQPIEMSKKQIKEVCDAYAAAAVRADKAGFDIVEIHGAHGYLISSFLSPLANNRKDEYGGSLENRARILYETVQAVRAVWPKSKPLFVRLSCSDWVPGGTTSEETVEVSKKLFALGVDVVDCSSGGNSMEQMKYMAGKIGPGYQVPFSHAIKDAVKEARTAAVGIITQPAQAEEILTTGKADIVLLAREFLRDNAWPQRAARELGVEIAWATQYSRGKPEKKGAAPVPGPSGQSTAAAAAAAAAAPAAAEAKSASKDAKAVAAAASIAGTSASSAAVSSGAASSPSSSPLASKEGRTSLLVGAAIGAAVTAAAFLLGGKKH